VHVLLQVRVLDEVLAQNCEIEFQGLLVRALSFEEVRLMQVLIDALVAQLFRLMNEAAIRQALTMSRIWISSRRRGSLPCRSET